MTLESGITDIQREKWKKYPHIERDWQTPPLTDYVQEALQADVPQRVLVVGIGGLAREALEYAKLPGIEVVGIDINPNAVESAIRRDGQKNITVQTGDILDEKIIEKLGKEKYGAVTFIGLLTNLITNEDAAKAISHAYHLLAPEGSLIISDYALKEGKEYWLDRYERDAKALGLAGYGNKDSLFGTFIIRPQGLRAQEIQDLSVVNLVQSVSTDNFERFARHRKISDIESILANTGFCLPLAQIQTQELAKKSINPSHPWEQETNIQIRAIKTGTRYVRRV